MQSWYQIVSSVAQKTPMMPLPRYDLFSLSLMNSNFERKRCVVPNFESVYAINHCIYFWFHFISLFHHILPCIPHFGKYLQFYNFRLHTLELYLKFAWGNLFSILKLLASLKMKKISFHQLKFNMFLILHQSWLCWMMPDNIRKQSGKTSWLSANK